MTPVEVRTTLTRLAAVGPHYAVDDGAGRPWSDLHDPVVLGELAGRVAMTLGGCEQRVAVSTLQLGLSARLLCVQLGGAALDGVVPSVEALQWSDVGGGVSLHMPEPAGERMPWPTGVLDELGVLVDTCRALVHLSERLLWGNVASAVLGVVRVLGSGSELADRLLADPRLEGLVVDGRRTTCCLFYRVPGGGLCGDCVLDHEPARV